jgi:fucose permease
MAAFNLVFAGWSFWRYEKEITQQPNILSPTEQSPLENQAAGMPQDQSNAVSSTQPKVTARSQFTSMAKAVKSKIVLLGALFIFAYQGAEVSISGWVISFLLTTRHGDPSSVGYVTAGFWAGITLGRFLLSHPAHKIGEKRFVYAVVVGAAAFQLLVWFVPNVVGDAVAVVSPYH